MKIEKFINKLAESRNVGKGFHTNIEEETITNNNFRKVLFTTKQLQLVVMNLKPKEDIDFETHPDTSQFIRVDKGSGEAVIDDEKISLKNGDAIIVPAGSRHNVVAGKSGLKLYTLYSPPHHPDDALHKTKQEAIESEKEEE